MVLCCSNREEQAQWYGKSHVLAGSYTNHSRRASGATAVFSSGVSEALVQHRTGHHSLEGLRKYERVTAKQELQVSSILSAPRHTEKLQPISCERSRHPSYPSNGHLTLSLAGCSFSGCTISFTINELTSTPQPLPEFDPIEELKGIDIQELLKFDVQLTLRSVKAHVIYHVVCVIIIHHIQVMAVEMECH